MFLSFFKRIFKRKQFSTEEQLKEWQNISLDDYYKAIAEAKQQEEEAKKALEESSKKI